MKNNIDPSCKFFTFEYVTVHQMFLFVCLSGWQMFSGQAVLFGTQLFLGGTFNWMEIIWRFNNSWTVSVCFQVEALSDAVSFRWRGAGAVGRRRWRRGPEGGWLRQHGVEGLATSRRRRLLWLALRPHLRLPGNQNQAGEPGAGKHQHQEEAEDLRD